MKKRILIACGSGIATSTVIADRVKQLCEGNGIDYHIEQTKVVEVANKSVDFDLIVSSTKVPSSVTTPHVLALAYLTGIGTDKVDKQIVEELKK